MLPSEIEDHARNLYNATNDTFFTSNEVMVYIYDACLQLAREALPIEAIDTSSTTTAGTRSYSFPTNFIAIKRLECNGRKLIPITMREDDALTLGNSTSPATGAPQYYEIFNRTVYLRPIPDTSSQTLTFYGNKQPVVPTVSETLEIPDMFHPDITKFVVSQMYAKDGNTNMASYYMQRWEKSVVEAKKFWRKYKRRDSFACVQDEDSLPATILGTI